MHKKIFYNIKRDILFRLAKTQLNFPTFFFLIFKIIALFILAPCIMINADIFSINSGTCGRLVVASRHVVAGIFPTRGGEKRGELQFTINDSK